MVISWLKVSFALDSLLEFEFKVSCLTTYSSSNGKVIYRRFLQLQPGHPSSSTFSERLLFSYVTKIRWLSFQVEFE